MMIHKRNNVILLVGLLLLLAAGIIVWIPRPQQPPAPETPYQATKVLKSDEADLRAEDEAALTDDATEWTHGEPIQWDQVDRLPRLVYRVRPEYPEALREQGVHATVRVRLTIDTAGRVERAEILDSPEGAFEDPAVAAAQQFVFDPATRNGVPVSFVLETSIEFNPFR